MIGARLVVFVHPGSVLPAMPAVLQACTLQSAIGSAIVRNTVFAAGLRS